MLDAAPPHLTSTTIINSTYDDFFTCINSVYKIAILLTTIDMSTNESTLLIEVEYQPFIPSPNDRLGNINA